MSGFGTEMDRAGMYGFVNGSIGELSGGSFKNGFVSGALSSLATSGFIKGGGNFAKSAVGGTVGFSALSGGVGAELSGGNFWRGAGTGATIGLLNHCAHEQEKEWNYKRVLKSILKTRSYIKELNEFLSRLSISSTGKAKIT